MNKKKLESWSLGKDNHKLIPAGGEILKSVGSEVLLIEFTRGEDGVWKTSEPKPIFILGIGEYDALTGTYQIRWKDRGGEKMERIIPEGFSFNRPEEDGWMKRFITYSLHFKAMEEELYWGRLRMKYDRGEGVLPIEAIQVLKGNKESLGYHNYIAAVIDTDVPGGLGKGILSFRISEIGRLQKRARSWEFGIRDWDGYYMTVQKYQEEEPGKWICRGFKIDGEVLGDLKIIDIQDPR